MINGFFSVHKSTLLIFQTALYQLSNSDNFLFLSDQRTNKDKREQYKKVKAHVRQDDGRVQAYGWSLPAKLPSPPKGPTQQTGNMLGVPVPVFCRPLAEKELGTKVSEIAPRFVSWS